MTRPECELASNYGGRTPFKRITLKTLRNAYRSGRFYPIQGDYWNHDDGCDPLAAIYWMETGYRSGDPSVGLTRYGYHPGYLTGVSVGWDDCVEYGSELLDQRIPFRVGVKDGVRFRAALLSDVESSIPEHETTPEHRSDTRTFVWREKAS